MNDNYRFINGNLRTMSVDKDKNILVEIQLLNGKLTANNWQFTNIEKHLEDFADTPLLYSVRNGKIANGHDFKIATDEETGEKYPTFIDGDSEHLAGWIFAKDGDKLNPHIENIDGVDWVVAKALIPRHYNREFEKEFRDNGNKMSISIEAVVTKYHEENGIEIEDEYSVVGTTILGRGVQPAVASANIRKLSAINNEELNELKLRVASVMTALDNINSQVVGEPQLTATNENKKGEKSKKMLKIDELKTKFPDFKVLSADENGNVVLMNGNSELRLSTANTGDNGDVAIGNVVDCEAKLVINNGENNTEMAWNEVRTLFCQEIDDLKQKLKASQEALTATAQSLKVMQDAEFERRKKSVVEAIKSRFNSFNSNRVVKINEDIFASLITDEKITEFAKCVAADGTFVGEAKACGELDTICLNEVMKQDKALAEKQASQMVLNSISPVTTTEESGIEALMKGYGD